MNKAAKQPNSSELQNLGESSAPIADSTVAVDRVENDVPEKTTLDQSPRKPRLMNTLLAKLKEIPESPPASESQAVDTTLKGDLDFGDGSLDFHESKLSHQTDHDEVWLGETQASDSTTRSMTFTYSPGSTPLPPYTIRRAWH